MADIEPIHGTIEWSSEAAASDALNRVSPDQPFIAFWIHKDGHISYSKANMKIGDYGYIMGYLIAMMNKMWEER